jgi:hypothetical protein
MGQTPLADLSASAKEVPKRNLQSDHKKLKRAWTHDSKSLIIVFGKISTFAISGSF